MSATARRWIAPVALCALVLVAAPAAHADPGPGHATRDEGNVVADTFEDVDPGLAGDLGDTTMPDVMVEALTDPEGGVGRSCTRTSRNARSSAPAGATQGQVLYFHPDDVPAQQWDTGVVCSDGKSYESNIGYSVQNWRRWMGRQPTTQGARLNGKAYEVLKRGHSYMGKSFSLVDVMYMKGYNSLAYYGSDTYNRLTNELNSRGWNAQYTKYVIYADLMANIATGQTASPAGLAMFNGNKAMAYKRLQKKNSDGTVTVKKSRWGCYDEGDTPAVHEMTHALGAVASGSADYYTAGTGATANHVSQSYDLMGYRPASTLSGKHSNGATYPAPLQWDQGSQSYTDRIAVTHAAYLNTMSVPSYKTC